MKKLIIFILLFSLMAAAPAMGSTRALQLDFLLNGLVDNSGNLLAGGTVEFYEAGTTTAKNVWTDKNKTAPYATYTLDSAGAAHLYGDGSYKIVIKDSDGVEIPSSPWDNIYIRAANYYLHTVTGTYAATIADDFLLASSNGGAVTVNLFSAATAVVPLTIKRSGSNTVTIDGYQSETINGSSTYTLSSDNRSVVIWSDGSNWQISETPTTFVRDVDGDTQIQVEESGDEDIIRFDITGMEQLFLTDGALVPTTDNDVDLGSETNDFRKLFVEEIQLGGTNVTATAEEINTPLAGASVTLAEFQQLETIGANTISAAQWQILGALSASLTAAEINVLVGILATVDEINAIAGITATAAELNRTDGLTTDIIETLLIRGLVHRPLFKWKDADEIYIGSGVYHHIGSSEQILSWDSELTYPMTRTGVHDGADGANTLTDSTVAWAVDEWVYDTIQNTTDGSSCVVTANTATTLTCSLAGGSDNDWDISDTYVLEPTGTDIYYIYIDDSAVVTAGSQTLTATEFLHRPTEPTWNDEKKGWYNGTDRCIFAVYINSSNDVYEFWNTGDTVMASDSSIVFRSHAEIETSFVDISCVTYQPVFSEQIIVTISPENYSGTSGKDFYYRANGSTADGQLIAQIDADTHGEQIWQWNLLTTGQVFEMKGSHDGNGGHENWLSVFAGGWYFGEGI
jgi:hypothetical protein